MLQKSLLSLVFALLFLSSNSGLLVHGASPKTSFLCDDTEEIDIKPRGEGSTTPPRAPSRIRIRAYYDTNLASVIASLSYAGDRVEVVFNNFTTGEQYSFEISGSNSSVMFIGRSSGYWTVSFTLLSGAVYEGSFIL